MLLADLFGVGMAYMLKTIKALYSKPSESSTNQAKGTSFPRILYYLGVFSICNWSGFWPYYLLFWFLPSITVLPVILRLRGIAEHFGLENEHELNRTLNYHCKWIEKFFIGPHNSEYHLDHHLFPRVPCFNLVRLHKVLLKNEGYVKDSKQSYGFFGKHCETVRSDIVIKNK